MGQDRKDGKDGRTDVTFDGVRSRRPVFRSEIRNAIRYEKGLVTKAFLVLVIVAIIVILRTWFFI